MMKTRIYIGDTFDRWRNLKESKGVKSDAQLAFLLLDSYERDHTTSTPLKPHGKHPPPPSSLSSVTRSSPERDDGDFADVQQLEKEIPTEEALHQLEARYRKLFNKKSRKWTLQVLKEKKDYSYIPALQRAVLQNRLSSGVGMPTVRPRRPGDPRLLGVLSGIPAPPTEELLRTQASRGIGQSLPQQDFSS